MPDLFVLSGADVGARHSFDVDVDLGRAPGVAIVLRAPSVSRRHAQIVQSDGRWFLEDLNSANGTTVGLRRVEREELTDGARFELGDLQLRFRLNAKKDPMPSSSTTDVEGHGELGDELELEGDWDAAAPEPAPTRPAPAPVPIEARSAPSSNPAELPSRAAAARAELAATQMRRGERSTAAGGRILQYKNVRERSGFLSADLAQHPAWVRLAVIALALAVFVGLAYGAFRLTTTLRTGTGIEISTPSIQ